MNIFRIRSRFASVVSLLFASLAAHAVYLNGDGTGQALIYPYYTAQSSDGNPFNTFVTVVNGSTEAKAVRVRFREARNGVPVLSFNLFLAPSDVWTGAVVPFATGSRLLTTDLSCTDPPFPIDFAPGSVPYLDFSNAGYLNDGAGNGLDRTREGFVEILEMATLTGASATAVTPPGNGVPPNCSAVRGAASVATAAPTGLLSGTLTLINVANGMDFTVRPEALAQLASRPYFRPASDPYPDFNAAEIDPVSTVVANGSVYRSSWDRPVDAVSATLLRSQWLSEFILDNATRSRTDIVVTFPTRSFYTTRETILAPFFSFAMSNPTCPADRGEVVLVRHTNREERSPSLIDSGFATAPLEPLPPVRLCAVATVLSILNADAPHMPPIGPSGVLGASMTSSASFFNQAIGFQSQNGWLRFIRSFPVFVSRGGIRWNLATGEQSTGPHSYLGLPVVGFSVRTFLNGTLTCPTGSCQGNYGGAYPLRYSRSISPSS